MEVKPEQGILGSREQFGMGLQKNPLQPQQQQQNMRLAFTPDGTAIYKPVTSSPPAHQGDSAGGAPPGNGGEDSAPGPATMMASHAGLNIGMGEPPIKRKRGRPRKYGPDGTMALSLAPLSSSPGIAPGWTGFSSPGVGSLPNPALSASGLSASAGSTKKARGRSPGSSKKLQMAALGSAGIGFTPHVITVKTGEDVSSKIMSFCQHGSRAVCILSANGAISNVTLRQTAMSGGTVTYEGRFEILSLSGSFLLSENSGQRSRTGGLSVSLAGPDGRVLGGGVAGLLTAATPVQVVVGSFIADGRKEPKLASPPDISPTPIKFAPVIPTGPSSPPSRGTLSESSTGPGSPLNQSSGACNNGNQQGISSMPWK